MNPKNRTTRQSLASLFRTASFLAVAPMTLGTLACGAPFADTYTPPTVSINTDGETPREELTPLGRPAAFDDSGVLSIMGFNADDDAVSGAPVSATFSAQPYVDGLPITGSATVEVDGVATTLLATTQTENVNGTDIVYLSFFDEGDTAHYYIVAVRADLLSDGASIAFGDDAALIVIDEAQNAGDVSVSGTLDISSYDADTGHVAGSLGAETATLTLNAWPQTLLPLTPSGEPLDTVVAAATGTFSVIVGEEGFVNDLVIDVDGIETLMPTLAIADVWDDYVYLQFFDNETRRLFGITAPAALVETGADIALGGIDAGAYVAEENGDLYVFTSGNLVIDSADLNAGGAISGSFSIDGEALALPCEDGGCGYDDEPIEPVQCTETFDAETFSPDAMYIEYGDNLDEYSTLPPGYDRMLQVYESGSGTSLLVLVPTGTILAAGTVIDLSPTVLDGRPLEVVAIAFADCDTVTFATGGTFTINSWDEQGAIDVDVSLVIEGVSVDFGIDFE